MLLKDNLNEILMNFHMNFVDKKRDILRKFGRDERLINYDNLFLKHVILSSKTLIF